MGRARQTFERRQLGLTLRRLRAEAGKSQQEAATAIGKARSRVVQLEDGEGAPAAADLDALLDLYAVPVEGRETVRALAVEARKRQGRRSYVDSLPNAYQRFADLEASATAVSTFEPGIIPGLLQAPAFVRAVIEEWSEIFPEEQPTEIEDRVAFRLARHARVFSASGPRSVRAIVDEQSLRSAIGDVGVMRDQLRHLLALIEEHPRLDLRVLPRGSFAHPGRGGGLTIFEFGGRGPAVAFSSVVYGPSVYLDAESDLTVMSRIFETTYRSALDPEDSRSAIERALQEA
ncbi:helix-turn-helix domain-containing protein [Saccharopolyspora sp. MS10]|uniref:helix-turn-helix domain-containing protein n=1 Tax=Saccharopolyspora sp. MS10 TaxID=3385973 RepID=UPI0039A1391B